jgi:hypothetical protein
MNGKTIIDLGAKEIARDDFDRTMFLDFTNEVRRAALQGEYIPRFLAKTNNVTLTDGAFDKATYRIKEIKIVEWQHTSGDGRTALGILYKIPSYEEAVGDRYRYYDFTATGEPVNYLEYGSTVNILPAPTDGAINIFGEIWPEDLTDSAGSIDVTTNEIGTALCWLAVADYFDFLEQPNDASLWRNKGLYEVNKWLKAQRRESMYKGGMGFRNPWGNL